jgi:hypothetical protein
VTETLDPAPGEFVILSASENAVERVRALGSVEKVGAGGSLLVLRRSGAGAPKEIWQEAVRAAGKGTVLLPVLYDRDRTPHYPTGEVTIRFDAAPSDDDVRRFCEAAGLRLRRRNEYAPQQIVCEPADASREYFPDLVDRLAAQPRVKGAWANTMSRYRRG